VPYGISKKFDDLEKFPWAEQAIEKMRLKGLVKGKIDGKFDPKSDVTKLEAIIMALRIMGWEDEISEMKELPKNYKGKQIESWATGYVTLAFDKGLLDDVDLLYFNPNEPALRHEVAKYIIRALGYEEDAQSHMNEVLPFNDAAAIPQGSIGYVYLINNMKLMIGNNNQFNPMGTLNRAEMAVLFDRLDGKVENDLDKDEYIGKIQSIDEDTVTIKTKGQLKTFSVDHEAAVYKNEQQIPYSNLVVGTNVLLQINEDKIIYIEVVDEEEEDNHIISEYTGTVVQISTTSPRKILVQLDTMQILFEAIQDVEVNFNNGIGSLDEIKSGDTITVTVDTRNRVSEINVDRDRQITNTKKIDGIITKIDLVGAYYLTIDDTRYALSTTASVTIPEETNSGLEDLKVGYLVICTLEDQIITEIQVKEILASVSGTIAAIGADSITLTQADENTKYNLDDTAIVRIDGISSTYDKLVVGMSADIKTKNGLIYQIDAKNQMLTVNGKILAITNDTSGYKLSISYPLNGAQYDAVYTVADDVDISIPGISNEDIEDLEVNGEGAFTFENNVIIKIVINA